MTTKTTKEPGTWDEIIDDLADMHAKMLATMVQEANDRGIPLDGSTHHVHVWSELLEPESLPGTTLYRICGRLEPI